MSPLRGVVLVNPATSFDRTPVRAVLPALTALPPDKIPVPLPKLGNEPPEVETGESPSSDAGKWGEGGVGYVWGGRIRIRRKRGKAKLTNPPYKCAHF